MKEEFFFLLKRVYSCSTTYERRGYFPFTNISEQGEYLPFINAIEMGLYPSRNITEKGVYFVYFLYKYN